MVPPVSQSTGAQQGPAAVTVAAEPVAVVGMACRYPGGIDSPAAYWRLLVEGRHVIREGPQGRWDFEAFFDPDIDVPGRCTSRWAGYFDDITGFDAAFFGISPREATTMDPQHRLLIELVDELPGERVPGHVEGLVEAFVERAFGPLSPQHRQHHRETPHTRSPRQLSPRKSAICSKVRKPRS